MSTYLWKYFLENDIERFRQLLATANYSASQSRPSYAGTLSGTTIESPGKTGTSPVVKSKQRPSKGGRASAAITLTRADINSKDAYGVTLLHLIASSSAEDATEFGMALLSVPMLDLYIQDQESGWTALHRALYAGNVTLARAIMERDIEDFQGTGGGTHAGGLIKIKDHEGNSPFDVYATTICHRLIPHGSREVALTLGGNEDDEDDDASSRDHRDAPGAEHHQYEQGFLNISGDELFAFGSNKNLTLGFGDEDDRQFPERVTLKRPQYLQDLYHKEHLAKLSRPSSSPEQSSNDAVGALTLPAMVEFKPIYIQDVQLSKLHTAVLTTDPESNLFICGYGQGGRLGTGDEATRFNFTNISCGGLRKRKVVAVALGQNHTIAVTSAGEVFTWGNNSFGQLGYSVSNQSSQDEAPVQLFPRQVFGLLKREDVLGCAASRTHSVLFTSSSLYTFGKHDGQLGLVDSDARSLEMQVTPRKVAALLFSSPVSMVTAIDKATACLLENHDVWVFANYGYAKVVFPLDGFSNYFLRGSFSTSHYDRPNHIRKICSGGDTICALGSEGDVFTVNVSQKSESSVGSSSTTNPSKIRGALSTPQRIWSLKKDHMAVSDVDVGQDGSIIICTNSGSVWRRVKRAKIKDTNVVSGSSEIKPKDFKFTRVPGLTRITAVRSNAFGAFAAVRRDYDVLKAQMEVTSNTLWRDLFPLMSFHSLAVHKDSETADLAPTRWRAQCAPNSPARIRQAILASEDIESDLTSVLRGSLDGDQNYDITIGSTVSDIRIPCHQFLLMARSPILMRGLLHFEKEYCFKVPDVLVIEYDKEGRARIMFQGLDILTLLNLVLYLYTDTAASVWNHARQSPQNAFRYRQVRTEVMKIASQLDIGTVRNPAQDVRDHGLEHATRLMSEPSKTMHKNMDLAVLDLEFFETGDVEIELSDCSMKVHSALICQRCPFFEGMFHGRAGGGWLSSRKESLEDDGDAIIVDLQHVESSVFTLVLRHLYADSGEEIFEESTAADLDTFLDLILDVMAVANELMIDRLSQICQKVLGAYVNTRNVCQLLNAVAPCSVTEFKDAALEYICLNLEGMLENHRLRELDQDLMVDLDRVTRDNQLACLPIVKSGRAEAELFEQHPELAEIMEKSRQVKIDSMALKSRFHEDEAKMAKFAKSPLLKARSSSHDMIFNMDDDETGLGPAERAPTTPSKTQQSRGESDLWPQSPPSSMPNEEAWFDSKGRRLSPASASVQGRALAGLELSSPVGSPLDSSPAPVLEGPSTHAPKEGSPWTSTSFNASKLSMKRIMEQASETRQSNISNAFSQSSTSPSVTIVAAKLSQKERKKLLQQQQLQKAVNVAQSPIDNASPQSMSSPWQVPAQGPKVSLKEELLAAPDTRPSSSSAKRRPSPSLTMRQTISGNAESSRKSSNTDSSSPRPLQSQQRRTSSPIATAKQSIAPISSPLLLPQRRPSQGPVPSSPLLPKSIRHIPSARDTAEPSLEISLTDILAQQQIEKDLRREVATAKRSLQEIQEEQAFQEWWDQEEAATRARLEAEANVGERDRDKGEGRSRSSGRGRGAVRGMRGGRGGRRGRGRGGGTVGGEGEGKGSRTKEAAGSGKARGKAKGS